MINLSEIEAIGKFVADNGIMLVISVIVVWALFQVIAIGIKYLSQRVLSSPHDELLERRGASTRAYRT